MSMATLSAVSSLLSKVRRKTDPYAFPATDAPGVYKIVTEYLTTPLPAGTIYRINTGAPLPPGMDAVIMVEDTEVVAKEGEEEKEVKLLAQVDKGENVRKEGSDVKVGEKVLEKGDVISAVGGELGTLAFIAKRSVRSCIIRRRPLTHSRTYRPRSTVGLRSPCSRPATSSSRSKTPPRQSTPRRPSPLSSIPTVLHSSPSSSTCTTTRSTSASLEIQWPRPPRRSRRAKSRQTSSSVPEERAWA